MNKDLELAFLQTSNTLGPMCVVTRKREKIWLYSHILKNVKFSWQD